MTRGRCGSLLLHRKGLAPSTPRRSPGALRFTPNSGHPLRADLNGRFGPATDSCAAARWALLFDHLVGAAEQRLRNCEAEHLGGLQINDHLDFRGLLNWQVGGLLTLENLTGVEAE